MYGASRKYNGLWSMPGLAGGHQCGEPDQFLNGVAYDPERVPVEYDEDWIPVCCPRWVVGRAAMGLVAAGELGSIPPLDGGANLGLTAAGELGRIPPLEGDAVAGLLLAGELHTVPPLEGDAVAGLLLAGELHTVPPLEGDAVAGLLLAGELQRVALVEDAAATCGMDGAGVLVVIPATYTPGANCTLAGTAALDTTYSFSIAPGVQHWYRFAGLTPGSPHHVSQTGIGGFMQPVGNLWDGNTCGTSSPAGSIGPGPTFGFVKGAGTFVWLVVIGDPSGTHSYTVLMSSGP